MRKAEIKRKTAETDIQLTLDLDGNGTSQIDTKCGFLNHMLTLFARHSRVNLTVICDGDIDVDFHHTVEDVGIVLGDAVLKSLGDKKGIKRYGSMLLPMDETLVLTSLDVGGRSYLGYCVDGLKEKVGDFDTELCEEFFAAFVRSASVALHIKKMEGTNSHHIIEGIFKSFAWSFRQAVEIDKKFENDIMSTKGVL